MKSLHLGENQGGRETTIAINGLAKRYYRALVNCTAAKFSAVPAAHTLGNPTIFSIGRCNPNLYGTTDVINSERPASLEFNDVLIPNNVPCQWINNHQVVVSQNEFGSNPQKMSENCNKHCCNQFERVDSGLAWIKNALHQKEDHQDKGQDCVNQITLWSKNGVHKSIMSLALALEKESKNV